MEASEKGAGRDNVGVGVIAEIGEKGVPRGVFRLEKYLAGPDGLPIGEPIEEPIEIKNAYVNVGGAAVLDRLIGTSPTAFDNTNAYMGVGDSSTAVAAGQTDLQAATNKLRKAMDATFPSRSGQTMTWKSTFASADANWVWNEAALFNASSAGTMLCRIVQSLGTKVSGTAWTLSYTITIP